MTRYIDRPAHNDVVKGGNTPPPVKDAALGGLEGIRRRLQVASSADKKVAVLRDVLRYGQAGRDLLKQIIKAESGAVQVAAYCLLNFDSQATEAESQEILGVINAAVQRAIDTRIDVRQISSPSLQDQSTVAAQADWQKRDLTTASNSAPGKASNPNHQSEQLPQPASKSPVDRTPRVKLPPIQPRSQAKIEAKHSQANSKHKSRPAKASKKDAKQSKKNQNGLKKWFNQTLGISDQ